MTRLILTTLEQGLIFSILAMGVYITYKILDTADLSVEGSFPFGAFVFARLINLAINPFLATILAALISSLAGLLTASLFIGLKIQPILAGILTMTMLFSINLFIAGGSSNIGLFDSPNIFDSASSLVILIIFAVIIKILIDLFLKTEIGYLLITTGDNEELTRALGESSDKYKILGFMLANGLIGLSGALMAQYNGFVDITSGRGIVVIALASIIIGDTIFKKSRKLKDTSRAIIGALIYQTIGTVAIDLGLEPNLLNLVNALIVILFIAYNNNPLSLEKLKREVRLDAKDRKTVQDL